MSIQVALYIRVSTYEQAEYGFSIEAQKQLLVEYCTNNDLSVYNVYGDVGISGKSIKGRSSLQQMLHDAKQGQFQEVIIWKSNRLARNLVDLLHIVEVLKSCGVTVRSLSEKFDSSTPIGNFTLQMLGAVGQLERHTILENSRLGRKQRDRQGEYCGARILGYNVISKAACLEKGRESNLVVNESEAKLIRQIFQWYAEGSGYKAIVNKLNSKGIRTKYNKAFSIGTVRKILRNVVYIGKIRFHEENKEQIVNGKHIPIVSSEIWETVQFRMKQKSKQQKRDYTKKVVYVLSSLLFCPICQSSMVGVGTGKVLRNNQESVRIYRYYSCSKRINKGTNACSFLPIQADYIEQQVYKSIKNIIDQQNVTESLCKNKGIMDDDKEKRLSLKILLEQEEELKIKKERLFSEFEEEHISAKVFKKKLIIIKQEMEKLIREKQQLEEFENYKNKTSSSKKDIDQIFTNLHQLLFEENNEKKKEFLASVIHKIVLDEKQKVQNIEMKLDKNEKQEIDIFTIYHKNVKSEEGYVCNIS